MARTGRLASPSDMVRSLVVILVPILAITWLFTRNLDDHPVTVVEVAPVLAKARAAAPYPVLVPASLPEGWRPVKVAWEPVGRPGLNGDPSVRNGWRLGYLDPDDTYVALEQGDRRSEDLIASASRDGAPEGRSSVGDQTWERRISPDERTRALVLSTPTVTTVVSGDVPYAELEAFASTLRAE